ncbi:MAG: hypothetical protein ACU0BS_02440 [Hasllibacter sp.]
MKTLLLSAITALGFGGAAVACPQIMQGREQYSLSDSQLRNGVVLNVVAGGQYDSARCNIPSLNGASVGYVAGQPDFSLYMPNLAGRRVQFFTQGGCDVTLLLNTGGVNWYSDDDDGGNFQANIGLTRPSNGRYDIWVGTWNTQLCNSQLVVRYY